MFRLDFDFKKCTKVASIHQIKIQLIVTKMLNLMDLGW